MTRRLYYEDSHLSAFSAAVLSCRADGARWQVILDRTAFFPEGGGQQADTGRIGSVRVLDVHEKDGVILHFCDGPLEEEQEVSCQLDWQQRFERMQNHSGEHVLSGTAHRLFGCENVGFHMNTADVVIDFDRELTAEEIRRLETEANEAVWNDLPVRVSFPDAQTLETLEYRSKKALKGEVRIVEIPGVDRCACCAPHVRQTGEIGAIKILDFEKHRGGTRIFLACGAWALADYREKQQSTAEISVLLSARRNAVAPAVQRLLQERDSLKEKYAALAAEMIGLRAAALDATDGNFCLFETVSNEIAMRELVNLLVPKCGGLAAVFFPGEGKSLRYIIGSRSTDLRKAARAINEGIRGRGGGRPEMIQGSATASPDEIRAFLENFRG